jgi:ribosomal protein S27AE
MDINACPKCGNIELTETIMQSGPHYSRIDCPDCGFIKWGKKSGKEERQLADKNVTFLVGVPDNKKMEIGLGAYEREQLMHQHNKTFHEFCKMASWFNNPNTDPKQKAQFVPVLKNMIETIYMQTKILEYAGIPDDFIAENLSLPF